MLAIDAATTAIANSKSVHRNYGLVSDTHAVALLSGFLLGLPRGTPL